MTLLSAVGALDESPIDRWLAEQADLTAVERFSQHHDAATGPVQERYYRDLMPATAPGPGQQYGFAVDLDACTGCKACVAACHSLNGLDDDETWRVVTKITGHRDAVPFQQTVTAACHHCVDPACLAGCPVDAYDKDPITGIVSHLDDQCIGCSYCTLTCPYEVPTFNHRLGIVRKCDLCSDRLAEGEAPACVQSCPNEAISVEVVDVAALAAAAAVAPLVPGAPPSTITVPSTTYRSASGAVAEVAPATLDRPAHGHPPLAVMLVLTQLAVGALTVDLLLRWTTDRSAGRLPVVDAIVIAAVGLLALGSSVLHLGRPRYAYRAVIGLRHSWLSREVVAFGAFTGLAVPYAALVGLGWPTDDPGLLRAGGAAVAAAGLAGVACSVVLYATTRRSSWRAAVVTAKFSATTAILGVSAVVWVMLVSDFLRPGLATADALRPLPSLLAVTAAVAAVKLLAELSVLRHLVRPGSSEGSRRARLLTRDLSRTATIRWTTGAAGGVALPLLLTGADLATPGWPVAAVATLALGLAVTAELAERLLFFTTASRPR